MSPFTPVVYSADVHDRIPGGSSLLHRHRDGNQQPSRTFSVGGFGNAVPLNVDPFPHKRVREVPDALDAGYSNFTGGMDGADDPLGSSIDGQALTPMSPKEVAMEPVPRPPQFCHAAQSAGAALGIAIFLAVLPWEMSSRHPAANDMLGVIGLVSVFWMFEVMPLPASSLLPMFLMPALGILDGGQVMHHPASSCPVVHLQLCLSRSLTLGATMRILVPKCEACHLVCSTAHGALARLPLPIGAKFK